jgi:hypothetical protein
MVNILKGEVTDNFFQSILSIFVCNELLTNDRLIVKRINNYYNHEKMADRRFS